MSNIPKSKRKPTRFQLFIDWINIRRKLTKYISDDLSENKISILPINGVNQVNHNYYLYDFERKHLLNLIVEIQRHMNYANSIYPTNEDEYYRRRHLQNLSIGAVNNLIAELQFISIKFNLKTEKYINLIPDFENFRAKLKAWRASTNRYKSLISQDKQKIIEGELELMHNSLGHNL